MTHKVKVREFRQAHQALGALGGYDVNLGASSKVAILAGVIRPVEKTAQPAIQAVLDELGDGKPIPAGAPNYKEAVARCQAILEEEVEVSFIPLRRSELWVRDRRLPPGEDRVDVDVPPNVLIALGPFFDWEHTVEDGVEGETAALRRRQGAGNTLDRDASK